MNKQQQIENEIIHCETCGRDIPRPEGNKSVVEQGACACESVGMCCGGDCDCG